MGETNFDEVAASEVRIGAADIIESELEQLDGVTPGAVLANKVLVAGASREIATLGPVTGDGDVSIAKTITSATPATERLIKGALTLTPATVLSVAAGGSLAGVRGEAIVSAGKTFVDGFLYGAQGKVTLNGTLDQGSAGRIAGALGQVDLASGTVTDGQVSGVWADLQGAPTLTSNDEVFPLRVTNSMSVACQAMAFFHGIADFWLDINEPAPSFIAAAGSSSAGTTGGKAADRVIKVNLGGTTGYIPIFNANT